MCFPWKVLLHQPPAALSLGTMGIQQLIQQSHRGHHPADNGTDRREKGNVTLSISLNNLDMQRRNLVKEKDTGKALKQRSDFMSSARRKNQI